jgi:hypothetical protein
MTTSGLMSLARKLDVKWAPQLLCVLESAISVSKAPERHHASFALEQAERRLARSVESGIETFGIPELIKRLRELAPETEIEFHFVHGKLYTGTCFVVANEWVGCEFVKKGKALTVP